MRQVNATQRLQIRLHWYSQAQQFDSEQIISELLGRQRVHPAYWPTSLATGTQKQCMTLQC